MFNISLVSLSLLSIASTSPLLTLNSYYGSPLTTNIIKSHFSSTFSNILYSSSLIHKTHILYSEFTHTLESALAFTNAQYTCQTSEETKEMQDYSETQTVDQGSECSELSIVNCKFIKCESSGSGGGLSVTADVKIVIHNTIFGNCTAQHLGGAALVCKNLNSTPDKTTFNDVQANALDVQYCCFQFCDASKDSYGTCLFSASTNTTLLYASTVGCSTNSQGAQFDLQMNSVHSQYVNITGGKSLFCGAIEYRYAAQGTFEFQTITNLENCFCVAFTAVSMENLSIENCNFVGNKLVFAYDGINLGMVHVIQKNVQLKKFYFIDNDYQNVGKADVYYASIQSGDGSLNVEITFLECYSNQYLYTKDQRFIIDDSCDFNTTSKVTANIEQLNLGECKGTKTALPFTPVPPTGEITSPQSPITPVIQPTTDKTSVIAPTEEPVVPPNSESKDGMPTSTLAGIGVGAAVGVAAIAALAIFLIKKFKPMHISVAEVETFAKNTNEIEVQNPLHGEAQDDPFEDDFMDHQTAL